MNIQHVNNMTQEGGPAASNHEGVMLAEATSETVEADLELSFWEKLRSAFHLGAGTTVFFSLISLLVGLSAFIPARRLHGLLRFFASIVVRVAGIRLRVRGLENLPRDGGFLLICNHVNMFDPMILYVVIPRHCIAIEKAPHFRWPLYGTLIRRWGNLPVGSSATQTRATLERAGEMLAAGTPVFIFPEGTRARNGQIGPFKKGAFHVALRSRVPLYPMVFKGANKIFREGRWEIRPGTEEIVILPAVPLEEYGPDDGQKVADHVRDLIKAELES